jgi:two-component system, NarL family, invasion response regulator UvrY
MLIRDGLKEILKQIPEITSIDEAQNAKETLLKVKEQIFDLILLDISLPDTTGLEVLKAIIKKYPNQRVLMLSMHPQEQYAIRALKSGASGYLTKDTASEELITAIKKITSGGKYISSSLAENLAHQLNNDFVKLPHETLSEREFEIMLKIAAGKPLIDIGNELFISGKTVSTYRSRLIEKMGMKNNAEITQYCMKNGLM